MPERSRPSRKRPGRFRVRRAWLVAGVLALIGFLYSQPLRTYLNTRDALASRTAEVRALEAQRSALRRKLSRSLRGPGLLRQARRAGFVRPGERLFIVTGIERWRRAQQRRTTIGRDG